MSVNFIELNGVITYFYPLRTNINGDEILEFIMKHTKLGSSTSFDVKCMYFNSTFELFNNVSVNETIVRIKGFIEYFHGEFKIIANQIFLNGES